MYFCATTSYCMGNNLLQLQVNEKSDNIKHSSSSSLWSTMSSAHIGDHGLPAVAIIGSLDYMVALYVVLALSHNAI